MQINRTWFGFWRRVVAACVLGAPLLAACGKLDASQSISVNIHGVNYSAEEFRYFISDPNNVKNQGGGESIEPFNAGGTTCCYALPKKWRPGMKIKVHSTYSLAEQADGTSPEVTKTYIVDVPQYVDGKAGELWVIRAKEGAMSVVSSDYPPNHLKWPGSIKGWPVPSLAYQRERWELYRKHEAGGVALYLSLLEELHTNPEKHARKAWDSTLEYEPEVLKGFSGPNDQLYLEWLKKDYEASLVRSNKLLEKVMKEKP
ncbi:MAG: DUF3304 domain-containing protein [Pseudomonadota bacterium]